MRSHQQRSRAATALLAAVLVIGGLVAGVKPALASSTPTLTIGSEVFVSAATLQALSTTPIQVDASSFKFNFEFELPAGVDEYSMTLTGTSDAFEFKCPGATTFSTPIPGPPNTGTSVGSCSFKAQTAPVVAVDIRDTVDVNLSSFSGNFLVELNIAPLPPNIPSRNAYWALFVGGDATGGEPQASDPTVSTVAVAVEQSAAAGVAGTSNAVLIRREAVVPVVSRVSTGVGPRGGVVLEAEGLRATFASSSGAREGSGVIVPLSGDLEMSIVGGLVPGAVVEVWVNSTPRLVAAALVPDTYEEGDSLDFTVPLGAPLDGGEPIEEGAHTLQVRMYTGAGFEVLSTGITVGGVVPSGVPAGGGPLRLDGVLFTLLGAAGLVGLAVRRTVFGG